MEEEFYLIFFIICVTLLSESGASPKVNAAILGDTSSDLHVRKKRIIDYSVEGPHYVSVEQIPYIVNIFRRNVHNCGGVILSSDIILTAGHCVFFADKYHVLSGSMYLNSGIYHNITMIIIHNQYYNNKSPNDLAMLKIYPPIDLDCSPNRKIELYRGPIPQNAHGIHSGWGCTEPPTDNNIVFSQQLRAIALPFMNLNDCKIHYRGFSEVTSKYICTYDTVGYKSGCYGDSGGPLTISGYLVGILSWCRMLATEPNVFVRVIHRDHRVWIAATMNMLNGVF